MNLIAPGNNVFQQKNTDIFRKYPGKQLLWETLEALDQALLMSTNNICFDREIRNYWMATFLLSGAMDLFLSVVISDFRSKQQE